MARSLVPWAGVVSLWLASCGAPNGPAASPPGAGAVALAPVGDLAVSALVSGEANTPALTIQAGPGAPTVAAKGDPLPDGAILTTPAAGRASFTAPAAGLWALNAGSELGLALSSGAVELRKGELFVESPRAAAPLAVKVPGGTISFLGATLDIRHAAEGVEVSVLRGKATLQGTQGPITLRASERGHLAPDGRASARPSEDLALLTDWTRGLRQELAQEGPRNAPSLPGLGTLRAKTPGSSQERAFRLLSQEVRVSIVDQVAITEVEQIFENPASAVVEGSFRFTLPPGASVTRYAMSVGDRLMEGELVERDRGRQIMRQVVNQYLEEQARLRDPALVEWTEGNTFSTRIFPILPKEKKRVVLAYTQRLDAQDGRTRYLYPLAAAGASADRAGVFTLRAEVSSSQGTPTLSAPLYPVVTGSAQGTATASFTAKDFQAPADFVLDIQSGTDAPARLATAAARTSSEDPYFLLSLRPDLPDAPQPAGGRDWLLLVDTSQSRTPADLLIERGLVRALLSSFDDQDRARVLAYDLRARELTQGWEPVGPTLSAAVDAALREIEPAGATDLAGALEAAAAAAEPGRPLHVLVLGDLAPSVGELRPEQLSALAQRALPGATISTVGVGASVDELILQDLPRASGGVSYPVNGGDDLGRAALEIVSSQRRPVLSELAISIDGVDAQLAAPGLLPNLPEGRELVLPGRYHGEGEATITLSGKVSGAPFTARYTATFGAGRAENRYLPTLWAKARLDALSSAGDAASRKEAVTVSTQARVMSRYTSFIVLENDAMYREFGVEQASKDLPPDEAPLDTTQVAYEDIRELPPEPEEEAALESTAPPAKAAPAASRANGKSKSGISLDGFDEDFRGFRQRPCVSTRVASLKVLGPDLSPAREKELAALSAQIVADPLLVAPRKKLVAKLMAAGRYPEALAEAERWHALDRSNPALLKTLGTLYRLGGRADESLRIVSGVLDIDPEDQEILSLLADHASVKGEPALAYALALGSALRRPADIAAQLALAARAQALGRNEEVLSLLSGFVEVSAKGQVTVTGKLKPAQKTKLLALYAEALGGATKGPAAKSVGSILGPSADKADLLVELTWEGEADLDLWVLGPRGRAVLGDGVSFRESRDGKTAERLLLPRAANGRYRVQVADATGRAIPGTIKGKAVLYGFAGGSGERKKEIDFTLSPNGGLELGAVSLTNRITCR